MKSSFNRFFVLGICLAATAQAAKMPMADRVDLNPVDKAPRPQHNIDEDFVSQDFESGFGDWTVEAINSYEWGVGDASDAGSSEYFDFDDHTEFAYCNSDFAGDGAEFNTWLISPEIDPDGALYMFMDYTVFFATNATNPSDWDNYLDICARADGGEWEVVFSYGDGDGGSGWTEATVDLSEYVDASTIEVGFHYWDDGNWSFGAGVDDVLIYGSATDEVAPEIAVVPVRFHLDPTVAIDVTAFVTDFSGVASADLVYSINFGAETTLSMVAGEDDAYMAQIPAEDLSAGAILSFYVMATDDSEASNMGISDAVDVFIGVPAWLAYHDGEMETALGFDTAPWGAAVTYDPGSYPLAIQSVELAFSEEETNIDLSIWYLDEDNMPDMDNEVYSTSFDAEEAAFIEIELDPAISVNQAFAVGFTKDAGNYLYMDIETAYVFDENNLVTSGDDVAWRLASSAGAEGNWSFGVYVDADTDVDGHQLLPGGLELTSFPNPFNPTTTLSFNLPMAGEASLAIYNVQGQLVETLSNGHLSAGNHQVTWQAAGAASGVYLAVLESGNQTTSQKLLLVR